MKECICPVAQTTLYRDTYHSYGKGHRPPQAQPRKPVDQELISGYYRNNLRLRGKQLQTKTWPNILPLAEEYENYLNRLACCRDDIYRRTFICPPVRMDIMEDIFKELSQTIYQTDYSPNSFAPRKERSRLKKLLEGADVNLKYEETTYRTYYNRINELTQFYDLFYNTERIHRVSFEDYKNKLKKLYRIGRTTYHDNYEVPGRIFAKPTPPTPIDRYTLRRI